MVNYRRNFVSGGTFFFTVTVSDRRSFLLVENISPLRRAFRITRSERPFAVDAIVILPDHLHTMFTLPQGDSDFPGRWRRIKSLFTRQVIGRGLAIEQDRRGEYDLWQKRFWEHTIRNQTDSEHHVDYIHYNPVKHGLVTRVSDWPHSSFHRYVRQGWLPVDWAGTVELPTEGFGERKS